jgi:simple sugar transport system permease protein
MDSIAQAKPISPTIKRGGFARWMRKYSMQIAIVLVLVVLWAFFLWRSPRTFAAYEIYNSLMSTTPYYALMAIPLTLVIIAKEIDLSFPSIMAWGMAAYDVVFLLFSETNPS